MVNQVHFTGMHLIHTDLSEVSNGRTQSDNACNIGRSSLKFPGQLLPAGRLFTDEINHFSPVFDRRHDIE